MAMRCLYCGGSPWRPFRWLRDQEFCSNKHRELYRTRLQKVVGELAQYQHGPDATPAGGNLASEIAATASEEPALVTGEVLPTIPEGAPAFASMAPTIDLCDPAMAQELTEVLGLADNAPTTVWLPPDVFPSDLRPREGRSAPGISPSVPPASAAGAPSPIHFLPDTLSAAFENHVQIKRWGLKIRFQKV